MAREAKPSQAAEELVRQEVITQEELDLAREQEAQSGLPWYRQLVQSGKVSFGALEDILRYEIHPPGVRAQQKSLGNELVKEGILTQAQLKKALEDQKRNGRLLGSILMESGYVSRDAIGRVLARQYDMEYAELDDTPSDAEALELVPENIAQKRKMLPVEIEGDRLTVLISSPQVIDGVNSAGVLLGRRMHILLTGCDDIEEEIAARYRELREEDYEVEVEEKPAPTPPPAKKSGRANAKTTEAVIETPEETDREVPDSDRFEEIAKQASGTSVMKMVQTIIEGAVNSGATDVHLDPQEPETRVRYRIDGILHDVMSIPEQLELAVISRIKIISDLDITETRHPQDGHISMEINDREFDVRVATLPTFLGERVVLRLLDQSSIFSGIRDLGLEKEDEAKLGRIIDQPYGMILVTGPTGSGKTTSLYAALNQKNVMTDSIVTLEDPVEYQLSGINQVQIDTDIDLTFANTLRAALRQDIDVLLVGEIRDEETARIAVRAAMTGHLVFSTLHTNDAPEAISTLRNMGVPAYLVASALTAVVAQRLVRTICSECRTHFSPPATLLRSVGLPASCKRLYRGKGCDICYHTGNRGRIGIFEVLEVNPAVRRLINDEASAEAVGKAAKVKPMAQACRLKVKRGEVNPEEYLRVIRL